MLMTSSCAHYLFAPRGMGNSPDLKQINMQALIHTILKDDSAQAEHL